MRCDQMDQLIGQMIERHRKIVRDVLTAYAEIPYAQGDIERRLVVDPLLDNYMLMAIG